MAQLREGPRFETRKWTGIQISHSMGHEISQPKRCRFRSAKVRSQRGLPPPHSKPPAAGSPLYSLHVLLSTEKPEAKMMGFLTLAAVGTGKACFVPAWCVSPGKEHLQAEEAKNHTNAIVHERKPSQHVLASQVSGLLLVLALTLDTRTHPRCLL